MSRSTWARGPKDIHAHLIGDLLLVRFQGVLTAAEQQLVKTPLEYVGGHIEGAINIPVDELRSRLRELPKSRPIVAYCQVGQRGYLATRILMQAGYNVSNLGGGYKTYLLHQPQFARR